MPPAAAVTALSPAAKLRLAAEILAAYARVRATLVRRDVGATVGALRHVAPGPPDAPPDGYEVDRLARAVVRVLRLLPTDSRCLMRSLVLTRLLARRGAPAQLVIGVTAAPGFAAHAWVEHGGRAVLPPGSGFSRLVEL